MMLGVAIVMAIFEMSFWFESTVVFLAVLRNNGRRHDLIPSPFL
jgi:hypothetical protein